MKEPDAYEIEHDRLCSMPVYPTPHHGATLGINYRQWLYGQILPAALIVDRNVANAITTTDVLVAEVLKREAESECPNY